jgi:hypothetical protein
MTLCLDLNEYVMSNSVDDVIKQTKGDITAFKNKIMIRISHLFRDNKVTDVWFYNDNNDSEVVKKMKNQTPRTAAGHFSLSIRTVTPVFHK